MNTQETTPKLCECGCGQPLRNSKCRFIKGHQYKRATLEEKFCKHVAPSPGEECWYWQGATFSNGYGHIRHEGRDLLAHRVAWELEHGPIPDSLLVLHSCDTPGCIRVSHLFLGTHADNSIDMVNKGRHDKRKGKEHPSYGRLKTHCKNGHELIEDNVIWTNNGKARRCKICYQESNRVRSLEWLRAHREIVNQRKRERRQPFKVGAATGERHGLTTLTKHDVIEIRQIHTEHKESFVSLASKYNVSPATIANIVHRKTWRHI